MIVSARKSLFYPFFWKNYRPRRSDIVNIPGFYVTVSRKSLLHIELRVLQKPYTCAELFLHRQIAIFQGAGKDPGENVWWDHGKRLFQSACGGSNMPTPCSPPAADLAHLIRDIKFLTTLPKKKDQAFGNALLIQFRKLFHFWDLRDKIPKAQFDRRMLRIKKRILALTAQEELPPKAATLAKRFRKHGDAMFRFLFDPAVPPTNNTAEQTLCQSVIDHRITQGSRSLMGQQWNARIWTVLDPPSADRKQGHSAWQFLQNALSAYYFQTPNPSLLPQA